jgi:hypothetical protein
MSPDHSIDALTEDERRLMETIEADLDRLLAVEPSPEFAARVRARISAADRAGGWSFPWALAAAAVLTIVTGILFATLREAPGRNDSAAITTGHDVALPAPMLPSPVVAAGQPRGTRSVRARPAPTPVARAVEPEVLVPSEFRLAIGRVLEMVRAGTLDQRAFSHPTPASTERTPGAPAEGATPIAEESAEPVAPMVVEDLQVPAIVVAAGGIEKGFGQ